jgi:hypothetical protein
MRPRDWYKVLALLLWILPHVLLVVPAAIILRRRLYRELPCFFAYLLYEIAGFILMFTLRFVPSVTNEQYRYAYYVTLMLSVVLRFGVIGEVAEDLFRDSQFVKAPARRALLGVQGLLLVMSILLAVYAPGHNNVRWIAAAAVVNRGAAMVQAGLILSLLLFSRFLGVSWRRPTFGIALGLGVLTSIDLAIYALRAQFASAALVPYLNLMRTGTYLVCVLTWIGYLLVPELEPASPTAVPSNEVEKWNTELQHLLKD